MISEITQLRHLSLKGIPLSFEIIEKALLPLTQLESLNLAKKYLKIPKTFHENSSENQLSISPT
jgi:hypothetical protein